MPEDTLRCPLHLQLAIRCALPQYCSLLKTCNLKLRTHQSNSIKVLQMQTLCLTGFMLCHIQVLSAKDMVYASCVSDLDSQIDWTQFGQYAILALTYNLNCKGCFFQLIQEVLCSHLTSLKHDNIMYLVGQKFQVNKIILSIAQKHKTGEAEFIGVYFSCSLCCEVSHSPMLIPENLVHLAGANTVQTTKPGQL